MKSMLAFLFTGIIMVFQMSGIKAAGSPSSPCPPDKPRVNCFDDPCRTARCPAFPDLMCVSDYCGGCFARFFLNGMEVTQLCYAA